MAKLTELTAKEVAIANNESSLLGLIINRNDAYLKISETINYKMFHFTNNQILYKAISNVYASSNVFDVANLINYLSSEKIIDQVAGFGFSSIDYIGFLTQNSGHIDEIHKYAKSIIEQYKTDELNKLLEKNTKLINSDKEKFNINDLIAKIQINLLNLDISEINAAYARVGDVAEKLYSDIMNNEQTSTGLGLMWGFPKIDELILGSNPGDLIILAARPAMGKTAFALNIAANVAKANKTVLFFSLEMSTEQLVQRMLAIASLTPINLLRKKEIKSENAKSLYWTVEEMKKWKMFLSDKATLTISDITTMAKRYAQTNKIDLIVVDYLQLIADSVHSNSENRQQEVGRISRALKQLARSLECPIISLSQLSRSVEKREDKMPILSDLRESGNIEQDADAVVFLYRKDYYNKQKTDNSQISNDSNQGGSESLTNVIVAKNRHGATGVVQLLFQPECNRFFYEPEMIKDKQNQEKQKLFVSKQEEGY
ncbi:replicative DNA helicase [Metamycoplasma equirhinis]|uniref:replicative DNA helicase n=1 Tax=Metamycoplasma equirhinis TaxID=92402 RepID=UPI0035946AA2